MKDRVGGRGERGGGGKAQQDIVHYAMVGVQTALLSTTLMLVLHLLHEVDTIHATTMAMHTMGT